MSHRQRFYDRIGSQFEPIVHEHLPCDVWPASFQFTSTSPPPSRAEVEAVKDIVTGISNPLGALLLKDIARTFDMEIEPGLIMAWTSLIEIDAARIMVGGYLFKRRTGRLPRAIEELCAADILPATPTDRVTGLPLSLSSDGASILASPPAARGNYPILGLAPDNENWQPKISLPVAW